MALACGPPEQPEEQTDRAYFAIEPGTCFGLRGGQGDLTEVIVEVEREQVIDGHDTVSVHYRLNGIRRRTEYLKFEDGEVRVVRRETPGDSAGDVEFDPPYLLTRRPLRQTTTGPHRSQSTARSIHDETETEWGVAVTVHAPETLEEVPGHDGPVEVFTHFVVHEPDGITPYSDTFALSEGLGFTRVMLDGEDFPDTHLVAIWQADGPCSTIPTD
jgi:hypothetical protein